MSGDKLKQNHVFVKNNVGSLALHKAKQEIRGIKTIDKKDKINNYEEYYNHVVNCKHCQDFICSIYNLIDWKEYFKDKRKQDILRGARLNE